MNVRSLIVTAALLFSTAFAQPTIVTSVHPYYDLMRQIAGTDAEVVRVLPPGASPHTFDPTPRDVRQIAGADLVVINGGLDEWLLGLVEASGTDAPVVEVFELLSFQPIQGEDHDHGEDMHDDDTHDDEHHDDALHDDAAIDAGHACAHMEAGPIDEVTAVASTDALGTSLSGIHRRLDVSLNGGENYIRYRADEAETYVFFADRALSLAYGEVADGLEPLTAQTTSNCDAITTAFTVDLAAGDYIFAISDADDNFARLVVEHADEHDHDDMHDDEHHDEHHDDMHDDDDAHDESEHDESEHDDHSHEGENPHVWLDPVLMIQAVPMLRDALIDVDPANEALYTANADTLVESLEALHAELSEQLAAVAGAPFVPFHDAWPYFARRYGLDLVVEIEPFPGREPSPRYLAEALDLIAASGATVIFSERQLPENSARVVADAAGVDLYVLDPIGGGDIESYQDLLRYNADVILNAFSDSARR
ncbi:MAG: metal ABC transporter substrate-binding protein [Trueperaceae bacterium]|nr:metal ABC transporter substrate-binding protein [Trueperaceae bacterium]